MTLNEKLDLFGNDLSFNHYFEILCGNKSAVFARWLENGEIKEYDYDCLYNRSLGCAEKLENLAFGNPGGWVGIAVDTCKEWPIIFWSVLASGRNAVLMDFSLDDNGIAHLMKQCGATAVISTKKRGFEYKQISPEDLLCDVISPSEGYKPAWANNIAVCTSGTTSTSRVYVYNGDCISRFTKQIINHLPYPCFNSEYYGPLNTINFLPLSHIFGLISNVLVWPFEGYVQIYLANRAPQTILETTRKCKGQIVTTVPLLLNSIADGINKKLASQSAFKRFAFSAMKNTSLFCQKINPYWGLKVGRKLFKSVNANLFGDNFMRIIVGGAHVNEESVKLVSALGYAITSGFGMTETGITCYENKVDLKTRLSCSVGEPIGNCRYKIVPTGNDKNIGEMFLKSDTIHIGRMEEGKMLPPLVDEDGWFATGDIFKSDNKNHLWVVGRSKDIIIDESGENVCPDEIEDNFRNLPGVESLVCCGIKTENRERVTLVLNVGEKFSDDKYLASLAAEIDKSNHLLRPLKRVKEIYVIDSPLPVASTIKVKRAAVRDGIESKTYKSKHLSLTGEITEHSETATKETIAEDFIESKIKPIIQKIKECFAEELEISIDSISENSSFTDSLQADSLHLIGAIIKIENAYDLRLPEESYSHCKTILDLAKLIYQYKYGKATA